MTANEDVHIYIFNYTSGAWLLVASYDGVVGGDTSPYDFNQTWFDINSSNPLQIITKSVQSGGNWFVTYRDGALSWMGFPHNVSLEVGTIDGVYEWNNTGELNSVETTTNFSSSITEFLSTCTADSDGYCNVQLYVTSDTVGILNITNLEINYSLDYNPIQINTSLVQTFLGNSSGNVDIPLKFESSTSGILEISGINFSYRGGNKTYEIKAHPPDYSINTTYDVTYYYSRWDYDLPTGIKYIDFFPPTPTTVNETPFGQSTIIPIINVTNYAYGGKDFNFSMLLNVTNDCVNITTSNTSSKLFGTQLENVTWHEIFANLDYENSQGLWMWADLGCSYTDWQFWEPYYYFRACCSGCDVCSTETN